MCSSSSSDPSCERHSQRICPAPAVGGSAPLLGRTVVSRYRRQRRRRPAHRCAGRWGGGPGRCAGRCGPTSMALPAASRCVPGRCQRPHRWVGLGSGGIEPDLAAGVHSGHLQLAPVVGATGPGPKGDPRANRSRVRCRSTRCPTAALTVPPGHRPAPPRIDPAAQSSSPRRTSFPVPRVRWQLVVSAPRHRSLILSVCPATGAHRPLRSTG